MSRTVVGYIRQFLNNAASASPTGSIETVTGLPIGSGANPGVFSEFSDSEALQYSNQGVVSLNILTAGSGQTPGVYNVTASAGGAVAQITVAAGGTVTAQPVITVAGGPYTDAAIPTFTLAAGGTPATFQAVIGVLYSGVYAKVQLDPAVTGNVLPGSALYWLESSSGPVVTTTIAANAPDFAGVSIDPNFGAALPYAYIQQNGKARCLFDATLTNGGTLAFGDHIALRQASAGVYKTTFDDFSALGATTAMAPNAYVGMALTTPVASSSSLVRITRYPSRY